MHLPAGLISRHCSSLLGRCSRMPAVQSFARLHSNLSFVVHHGGNADVFGGFPAVRCQSCKIFALSQSLKCLPHITVSSHKSVTYNQSHLSQGRRNLVSQNCRAQPGNGSSAVGLQPSGIVLGIETSCDETGAAVLTTDGRVLGEALASQAELHAAWGGVVPKLAQGEHAKAIDGVVAEALAKAGVSEAELSAVAVTIGPGLGLCLRVGVNKARQIAKRYRLPMVGVHHMEAHALVARLTDRSLRFPFLTLLVSGGHNLLLLAHGVGHYTQLGTSVDDALGEAYDKTARLLGLDLSKGGGPALEAIAREGDNTRFNFPVPMRKNRGDCNFSYAGLKTNVRLAIDLESPGAEGRPIAEATPEDRKTRADIAASFQRVAVLHLEERTRRAIDWARDMEPSVDSLVVAGGVAANMVVRERLTAVAEQGGLRMVCPPPRLCTDNGVMVAWTGAERYLLGALDPHPPEDEDDDAHVDIRPRWPLGEMDSKRGTEMPRSVKTRGMHPSLTSVSLSASKETA